ncbi:MAG: exonuclease domain-containing protein [Gammaproteobacteria bacterium]
MANRKSFIPIFPSLEECVFIDIKTTGLRPERDRIREIEFALVKKNKTQIKKHRFINSIKKNSSLVKQSNGGSFAEIANQLHKIIKNKVIVSQNASFVYTFLKAEMLRNNIILNEKILCSSSLSRFVFPDSKEHHFKAINSRLAFDVKEEKQLTSLLNFIRKLPEIIAPVDLQNKLNELIQTPLPLLNLDYKNSIPASQGIYRCYDINNVVIFVGKSTSLSESVSSHYQLTQDSHKALQISKQIQKIDWEKTYGELGTLLLAAKNIKLHKPLFNRLVEKNKILFTILLVNHGNYLALNVINISKLTASEFSTSFGIFNHEKDAVSLVNFFINDSNLCYQVNSLTKAKGTCFRYKINKCQGACATLESSEDYNDRIHKVIKTFTPNKWPFKHKIAIKEICNKTKKAHFHIIENWVYIDTVQSLESIPNGEFENTQIDVSVYKYVSCFLNKKENYNHIIEVV